MSLVMPSWDQCMVPVLRVLGDGVSRQRRELFELAADDVNLTADQRLEIGTAGEPKYQNRVGWALSYRDRVGQSSVRPEVSTGSPSWARSWRRGSRRGSPSASCARSPVRATPDG